uniref:Integrator complex subunit 7 N-terminal domain-containing protein n=1 Tax=Hucho hucho TaxID=62062 RepID=A0A4W5NYT2_9TELE
MSCRPSLDAHRMFWERVAKSLIDDLILGQSFVCSRAAHSLRSIESQPSIQAFVGDGRCLPPPSSFFTYRLQGACRRARGQTECERAQADSNDPVTRAITLRMLGSLATFIPERKNAHHSVHQSLDSHDNVEVEAAIFASAYLSAQSN